MLLWLPSGRNKYIFFVELILISTIAHGILGILLFVVYKGGITSFRVELGKAHSPTLFVPLKRSVMSTYALGKSQYSGHGHHTSHAQGSKKGTAMNAGPQHASQHMPRLSSDTTVGFASGHDAKKNSLARKKVLSGQTYHDEKQTNQNEKEIKAEAGHKSKAKKNLVSKIALPKDVAPKKESEKKRIAEETIQPESPVINQAKPAKPLSDQIQSPAEEPVVPAESVVPQSIAANQETPVAEGLQEPLEGLPMDEIILGGASATVGEYVSAEQARIHECIEQEIISRWRPPRGLRKDLVCHIKCNIGSDGAVASCVLEKPSGVLIYDMAARSAAKAMSLPRWAWGKEFTIIFKQ